MGLPVWFDDTFILALIGLTGGGLGYLLMFCLKSRCSDVECCCIKCKRQVLTGTELNQVTIQSATPA